MNQPDYRPPREKGKTQEEGIEPDWELIRDVACHGIGEPLVAGACFALGWLGTFYFLKQQFSF